MRIISQDGMIDFPYEQAVINIDYRNKTNIVANGINCNNDAPFEIAKYQREEDAMKAMEMLREVYKRAKQEGISRSGLYEYCSFFRFPRYDEIDD